MRAQEVFFVDKTPFYQEGSGRNVTEASKSWVAVLVIVLAGLLVYSNNYKGEFIWDDYDTIVEHPDIRSLSSIPKLFWSGPDSYNTPLSLFREQLF